eukprot:1158039-Pelagomonas_calceolata.AAC.9
MAVGLRFISTSLPSMPHLTGRCSIVLLYLLVDVGCWLGFFNPPLKLRSWNAGFWAHCGLSGSTLASPA